MVMVDVGQRRIIRIVPTFGIEMQTKDKIEMQLEVYHSFSAANLDVTVKLAFALPANRLLFLRIVWIKHLSTGLGHAVFNQNFPGQFPKIIGTSCRDRFVAIPNKQNLRA